MDAGFGGQSGGNGGGGHTVCVGGRVAHNHVKGAPHGGMLRSSFDKTFEYNDFREYCTISGDLGGLYSYITSTQGSYEKVRFNYFSCGTNYLYPAYLNPGPPGGEGIQVDGACIGDVFFGNVVQARRDGYGLGTSGSDYILINLAVNCQHKSFSVGGPTPYQYDTNAAALGVTTYSGTQTGLNESYSTDPGFLNRAQR